MRFFNAKIAVVLFLFIAMPVTACAVTGVVETVVDGDTYDVRVGSDLLRVRCLLIDTPELHHPLRGEEELGREAMEFARSVLLGREVCLEFEKRRCDRYGRTLAHVWYPTEAGTSLIAADLCLRGLALPLFMEDGASYVDLVERSTELAAHRQAGLWSAASGRRYSPSQANCELTVLRGNFITMTMVVKKVVHRGSSRIVYPQKKGVCLSIRDRIWVNIRENVFDSGMVITVVGKVKSGYRGPVLEVHSPAQLGVTMKLSTVLSTYPHIHSFWG